MESSHARILLPNLFGIYFIEILISVDELTLLFDRECHGSLIEMTASEYQKLWLSEGGGQATPGYAEIMVPVHPYHANGCFYIQ